MSHCSTVIEVNKLQYFTPNVDILAKNQEPLWSRKTAVKPKIRLLKINEAFRVLQVKIEAFNILVSINFHFYGCLYFITVLVQWIKELTISSIVTIEFLPFQHIHHSYSQTHLQEVLDDSKAAFCCTYFS